MGNVLLKLFICTFLCIFFCHSTHAADDMTDFDYDFIDNAFSNPNPSTNKQFEEVMKQYENREPTGIFYKMRKFFNRDNPEFDKTFKKQYENPNNQPLRIKDAPADKPSITIGADFYDSTGKTLEAGHYQADFKQGYGNNNDMYTISLLQGNTRVADIKAIPYQDDWETPAVVYCRTENVHENLIRIIYSNLDITILGYIKLKP